jgi:lactate permease
MWQHNYEPLGGSLALSAPVAALPIVVLFLMLGVWRTPTWKAALAGLGTALAVSLTVYGMPVVAVDVHPHGALRIFPIA